MIGLGDKPVEPISILWPVMPDSVSYDQGKILLVSATKGSADFVVSTQWQRMTYLDISGNPGKESFPKDFYSFFKPGMTLEQVKQMHR